MEIVNTEYPDSIHGFPTITPHGKSLLPIFKGKQRDEPEFFISGMDKFRMYRSGDYKIVRKNGGGWELYNLKEDPTERLDLAQKMPDKCKQLVTNYEKTIPNINKGNFRPQTLKEANETY